MRRPRAAQLSRRIAAALRSSLGSTTRLPLRSTRGPMMSTVPETPSKELADTKLSAEGKKSLTAIVMLPPCPSTAWAMIWLSSSTSNCGSIAMLPPLPLAPMTEVVIWLSTR